MTLILIVVVVNLTFDMTGRYERLNIPSKQLFNIYLAPTALNNTSDLNPDPTHPHPNILWR